MPDWLTKLREGEEEAPVAAPAAREPEPVTEVTPAEPQPVSEVAEPEVEAEDGLPPDPDERLELARIARDKGEIEEAVRAYDSLVSRGIHLDSIIDDLQQTVKSYPSNPLVYQLMGDAMMKDGRLQSALEVYRQALSKL
jgi:tetratricopeptide (TPR) repeat protein